MKKVVIVGGGISGLTAAYRIKKIAKEKNLPLEITVLEKENRLGGVFLTEKVNGFLIEGGIDCFESEKPYARLLSEELGLKEEIIGGNEQAHLTYIFWNGKLWQLPRGLLALAPSRLSSLLSCPLLSWKGKLRAGFEPFIPPYSEKKDISLAEFYKRRFGKEIFDRVAEPLFGSIYAGIPENISAKSCWPRALEMEKEYGSLIKAMLTRIRMQKKSKKPGEKRLPIFLTFRQGMTTIIDKLRENIGKENIQLGKRITALGYDVSRKKYLLTLNSGTKIETDACILATTPSYLTADILRDFDTPISDTLRKISYVSSATISLGYERKSFNHPLEGFGVLVSRQDGLQVKAISWASTKFSGRSENNDLLIRCFVGNAEKESIVYRSKPEILAIVKEEVKKIMGIDAQPQIERLYCWPNSMPQYTLGHEEKVKFIEERVSQYPGLQLVGNSYRGIGISDCVNNANQAAGKVVEFLNK